MVDTAKLSMERVLMDGIQEMVFIVKVDIHGKFYYEFFNQEVTKQIGLDKTSFGKNFHDSHPKKVADFLELQYQKVLQSGESCTFEDSYFSVSGEQRFSSTRLSPFFNEFEECTHIAGIVKNITNEKFAKLEAEEAWDYLEESKSRYRSLYDNNTDAVFTIELDGTIMMGNRAVEKMTGFKLNELHGTKFLDYIAADNHESLKFYFEQALDHPLEDHRIHFMASTGEKVGCLIKLVPIIVRHERVGIYAILKDMTELDKMTGKFAETENLFQIITENAHDVIVLLNEKGETMYVSPSCQGVYGLTRKEVESMPMFSVIHPEDIKELERSFAESILTGEPCKMQLRVKHKTRGWVWSELLGTPVFDENNEFIHKVLIVRDISQQKDYEAKLEFFAYHDSLTELPNRRMLTERLTKEIKQGNEFVLMILDIDDFKDINDEWGHEIGDQVIKEFAARLTKNIDESDLAARLGGDEFVVLYTGISSAEKAVARAAEIRSVMEKPWKIKGASLQVTTSIGITITPAGLTDPSAILKKADHALYEAKNMGKNHYRLN